MSILSLPFRRGTHLSMSSTIRQYINTKYDQHPDMFKPDLQTIDELRRDAVNVREPHPAGIAKLTKYAAQLVWVAGKFPIDIGAEFSWYPALGYNTDRPLVRNNLKYELMNILYNLASLYSQLAFNTPRANTDGLKTAANYFSNAAGVLSHLQSTVLPELRMSDPPEDMDAHTLDCLTQLMLAQSQECFWQKAVMDGYKDASIAKLATRVSDLYNLAGEAAVKSEAVSSSWIHHMTAKHHHFAAAAQYRAACDALEKRRFGEEVARLQDAVACVNEGLKAARVGQLSKPVVEDLSKLRKKVEEDLKRAEKDNDVIYLQTVPPKSELKILERANMAIARIPPQVANPYAYLGENVEYGPALFSRLVPFSVHVATSIYEERRDRLVNQTIIQKLEDLTENIHTLLTSLGLPGSLQAMEKPIGLPQSLLQHAEEIRQADAVQRVRRSLADVEKLRAADLAIFEEGKAALAAEEDEDARLRSKYGTDRWTRLESHADPKGAELRGIASEIEGYFASSSASDAIVRDKFIAIESTLSILTSSDRTLLDYVPSSRTTETSDAVKSAIGKLRSAYSDILRLESRRRKKIDSMRDSARRDDIKPDILKEAARLERSYENTTLVPAHFEDFFDRRLDKLYDPELENLRKEEDEQDCYLAAIERANREFEAQKRGQRGVGVKDREEALQRLDGAFFRYKEVVNNLEVARKFYNDLNKIVGMGFRDVVRRWVGGRAVEGRGIEEELNMPSLATLNITPEQQPNLNVTEQQYYTPDVQQPQPRVPQTWKPEGGIRFGEGSSGGGTWNPGSGIRFG